MHRSLPTTSLSQMKQKLWLKPLVGLGFLPREALSWSSHQSVPAWARTPVCSPPARSELLARHLAQELVSDSQPCRAVPVGRALMSASEQLCEGVSPPLLCRRESTRAQRGSDVQSNGEVTAGLTFQGRTEVSLICFSGPSQDVKLKQHERLSSKNSHPSKGLGKRLSLSLTGQTASSYCALAVCRVLCQVPV